MCEPTKPRSVFSACRLAALPGSGNQSGQVKGWNISRKAAADKVCTAADACAADDDSRFALIEAFLLPLWSDLKHQPTGTQNTRDSYADWAQGLALRAATSSTERSLRQVERRIKQWAGLPMRELRALSRAEKAFFQTLMAAEEGPVNWAAVAEDGGYADQSHMCRESRRVTGFSPKQLNLRIETDESFWAHRIWE